MLNRRGLITGLISLVAAPAIVRAGSLMPVKVMLLEFNIAEYEALKFEMCPISLYWLGPNGLIQMPIAESDFYLSNLE